MMALQPVQLLNSWRTSTLRYIVDGMEPMVGARAHTVLVTSPSYTKQKVCLVVIEAAWACLVL